MPKVKKGRNSHFYRPKYHTKKNEVKNVDIQGIALPTEVPRVSHMNKDEILCTSQIRTMAEETSLTGGLIGSNSRSYLISQFHLLKNDV